MVLQQPHPPLHRCLSEKENGQWRIAARRPAVVPQLTERSFIDIASQSASRLLARYRYTSVQESTGIRDVFLYFRFSEIVPIQSQFLMKNCSKCCHNNSFIDAMLVFEACDGFSAGSIDSRGSKSHREEGLDHSESFRLLECPISCHSHIVGALQTQLHA